MDSSFMLPGAGRLPLRKRDGSIVAYASVDLADYSHFSRWRWHRNTRGYVVRTVYRRGGGTWTLSLHRAVLGLGHGDAPGREVDHRNGDALDCRRGNLRIGTASNNQQNRRGARTDSLTGELDVSCNSYGRWRVRCQVDGRRVFVGAFDSREEAVAARDAYRAEHMPFSME